ncbi:recombination regulator RecX [Kitasatospora sp. MAP5-34]|uniref:recombination regulator RecX n=1 Tax=Kitasatospora sp. MAP5-34 TaxID=3035102 RepID=UPI0024744672|nr:recombination regulator RecX [Kitasatospora sp. MAP5-34]MDH6576521.1 regulatory protein [Kitasatospora sp. MAP5-34]
MKQSEESTESGGWGPPDWWTGGAESPERAESPAGAFGGGIEQLEVVRASELPVGRRRRRTAVADEQPAGRPPADPPPDLTRERRRKSRAEQRPEESTDPAARARDICLRLLTGTAKTRKQLADALRKREIPDEVAEEVLDRYEDVGLIDDAAFAEAWVESRHAVRGLGRRALAQELRTRGVAGELVEQAVAQVDAEDEEQAARALVDRKLRATAGLDRQVRTRRLVGMLARRGYSEGLAFRVVRAALSAGSEGSEEAVEEW